MTFKPFMKRGIALSLAFMMCFSLLPAQVFAAELAENNEEQIHVHTEECVKGELKCELEEHTHQDACCEAPQTEQPETEGDADPVEGDAPEKALICELKEHTHGDECYTWSCEAEEIDETVKAFVAAVAALPEADEITEENFMEVGEAARACSDLYDELAVEYVELDEVVAAVNQLAAVYDKVAELAETQGETLADVEQNAYFYIKIPGTAEGSTAQGDFEYLGVGRATGTDLGQYSGNNGPSGNVYAEVTSLPNNDAPDYPELTFEDADGNNVVCTFSESGDENTYYVVWGSPKAVRGANGADGTEVIPWNWGVWTWHVDGIAVINTVVRNTVMFKVQAPGATDFTTVEFGGKDSVTVKKGEYVDAVPTMETVEGYTFDGWYLEETCTTKVEDPTAYPIESATIFYGRYVPVQYTLSYAANGGTGTMDAVTENKGTQVTVAACEFTAPAGKEFEAWKDGAGNTYKPDDKVTLNSDITLTAQWKDANHTLSYTVEYFKDGVQDGKTNTVSKEVPTSVAELDVTGVNTTPDAGYELARITVNGQEVSAVPAKAADGTAIKVYFSLVDYEITYNLDGGSLKDGDTNPGTYTVKDTFALKNPTKLGYTFLGWTGSNSDTPSTSVTIAEGTTGNLSYTANWEQDGNQTHSLNVQVEYYKDGKLADTVVQSVTGKWIGEAIEVNVAVDTGRYEGYTYDAKATEGALRYELAANAATEVDADGQAVTHVVKVYYVANEAKIVFVTNGGTAVNEMVGKTDQTITADFPATTRTGYTLEGWYADKDLTNRAESLPEKFPIGTTTYYANWTVRTDLSYTVNYLDKDTNEKLADPTTVENQTFGTRIFAEKFADADSHPDIPGYEYKDTSIDGNGYIIGVDNNVINLYYTKRTNIPYTVKYLEQGTNKVLAPNKSGTGTFEATVTENAENITGYTVDKASKELTIGSAATVNEIIFYYAIDPSQTKTLSYTVEYYQDGARFETDEVENEVQVLEPDTMTVDASEIAPAGKYEGFTLDTRATGTIPTEVDGTKSEVIKVYYATDKLDRNDPESGENGNGDGTPDKYQLTVTFQKQFDDGEPVLVEKQVLDMYNGTGNMAPADEYGRAALASIPDFGDEEGYVKDGWAGSEPVVGAKLEADTVYTCLYATDKLDESNPESGRNGNGDGIPDKYQIIVRYVVENGTASFTQRVLTKLDGNGEPSENGSAVLGAENIPSFTRSNARFNRSQWVGTAASAGAELTGDTTYTYRFYTGTTGGEGGGGGGTDIPDEPVPGGGDPDDGEDIDDERVPLASATGLNDTDHFAYIVGYSDDTVRPTDNITRAEVATIYFRLMTELFRIMNWSTTNDYSDVNEGDWYNNAISTCTQAGITFGYEDGTFLPNRAITRAEFAAWAANLLDEEAYTGESVEDFTDTVGHWASLAIRRAVEGGWIDVDESGLFRPDDFITRAEAVTIFNRMLNRVTDEDHMVPEMKTWIDNPKGAWYYEAIQEATNEHDYDRDEEDVETWTGLLPNTDWAELEKQWAEENAPEADAGEAE